MKKILSVVFIAICSIWLASCSGKGCDLLILNWGDYIADELISAFESEYGVTVKVATTDSNEQMYTDIKNMTAEYDLVVPSDYMLDQMKEDGLIKELDYTQIENYSEDLFVDELVDLMNSEDCKNYKGYYVPYFWGSLGIMYNKRLSGVEEAVKTHGWKVLFEHDLLPSGSKVGMYNVSRDALAAAELYKGYSLNTTNKTEIDACMDLLKNTQFQAWGTDDLKLKVSQGNLDVALVYSGDFFDAYYADLEAEEGTNGPSNTLNYSIYAPTTHNNVFFYAMAIPNTATNEELAYKFLNFLLDHDNSYMNAEYIGYCPTVKSVYEQITTDVDGWGDIIEIKAYDPTNIINTPDSKAEVYKYLGSETYSYIETKFLEVLSR